MDNKLFGNKKVIDELMEDFSSISATNIPDIDQLDAYIALDVLENINDGELYTGMLVALGMVAKRFRYECCEYEDYKPQYYAEQLIKEIEPILTDVENVELLGVFIQALNLSIGRASLMAKEISENIINTANAGAASVFSWCLNRRKITGYYD